MVFERHLGPRQFAERCGVNKATVYVWVHSGAIPATVTPSGRIRIPESALKVALRPVIPNKQQCKGGAK